MRQNLLSMLFVSGIILMASCTVQKRQHLPGYHLDWHSKANNRAAQNDELAVKQSESAKESSAQVPSKPIETKAEIASSGSLEASVSNEINLRTENSNLDRSVKLDRVQSSSTSEPTGEVVRANGGKFFPQSVQEIKSQFKKEKKEQKKSESSLLRIIGWVLIVIGLITLFGSLIAGALVMLLGLVFVLAG